MLNLDPVRLAEVISAAWRAADDGDHRWCARIARAAHELETNPWLELDPQGRLLIGSPSGCCYAVSGTGASRCQCKAYANRRPCWHRAARELAVRYYESLDADDAAAGRGTSPFGPCPMCAMWDGQCPVCASRALDHERQMQIIDRGEAERPDLDAITPPSASAPLSVAEGPFCRDCGTLVWDGAGQCAACQNSDNDLTLCPDCGDPTSMAGRTYQIAGICPACYEAGERAADAERASFAKAEAIIETSRRARAWGLQVAHLTDRIAAMRKAQADIDECFA